ncbi:hypothetical protein GCM10023334_087750 [Nonomuraea thailandensis]
MRASKVVDALGGTACDSCVPALMEDGLMIIEVFMRPLLLDLLRRQGPLGHSGATSCVSQPAARSGRARAGPGARSGSLA